MKTLRFFFTLMLFVAFSLSAQAQLQLGAGAGLGANFNEVGIQVRGQYSFTDTWRGAADFTYFLDGVEGVSIYGINANAHYRFTADGAFQPYALAGLGFFTATVDLGPFGTASGSDVGINVGGGGNFPLGDSLNAFAEASFGIGGAEFGVFAGLLFNLGD